MRLRDQIAEEQERGLLLPTPSAMSPNEGEPIDSWLARRERVKDATGNGNGFGTPLGVAVRLNWGDYEPAVRLWESLTRPAPAPTLPDGKNGNHRLSAAFCEWMMGYPAGHVTDIIARNPAIKACGNGCVPQQVLGALSILWPRVLTPLEEAA